MRKIATPQDLQAELRRLLAECQGSDLPSRQKLAIELRGLADRVVASSRVPQAERMVTEAKKLVNGATKLVRTESAGDYAKVEKHLDAAMSSLGKAQFALRLGHQLSLNRRRT